MLIKVCEHLMLSLGEDHTDRACWNVATNKRVTHFFSRHTLNQNLPFALFADLLTYLDKDMLIGRATQLGGSFIFSREGASGAAKQLQE